MTDTEPSKCPQEEVENLEQKPEAEHEWGSMSDENMMDAVAASVCTNEQVGNDVGEEHEGVDSQSFPNHNTPSAKLRCKFGMEFRNGKFVQTNGNPFVFDVHDGDRTQNQARYEEIGEVVTEVIYELLESEGNLMKYPLKGKVVDRNSILNSRSGSFIFLSQDFQSCDKLLMLIHGSGAVRAGQWARRLILNDHLDSGTQLPYIKKAQALGYGVVILNTNYNSDEYGRIDGHSSPESHGESVWSEVISLSKASKIAIVAHSYGGSVVSNLLQNHISEFQEKVKAIALTDSGLYGGNRKAREYAAKVARNWVTSYLPVGTRLENYGPCMRVSAGTLVHEETSWNAFEDVFKFIEDKFGVERTPNESAAGAPPEADYSRPEADYSRPEADYSRPEADYSRPEADYSRPEADYSRPEADDT